MYSTVDKNNREVWVIVGDRARLETWQELAEEVQRRAAAREVGEHVDHIAVLLQDVRRVLLVTFTKERFANYTFSNN